MEKINVHLYGGKDLFGSKEAPLVADIIYCDNCDRCSLYKEGKCLRCREFMANTVCKYGRTSTFNGYTSRSKKYFDFKDTYEKDPVYRKLEHPRSYSFADIGDYYWIRLCYASIDKGKETGKYFIQKEAWVANKSFFIPKEDLTAELLDELLSADPRALMGGIIYDYQKKQVPNFVHELRKVAPELFARLCKVNDKYMDYVPDYRDRYARIDTLVVGSTVEDCHGNRYTIRKDDDGKVFMDGYMTAAIPFWGSFAYVKVYPKDGQTIKVSDNSWCDENTKFE